MNNSVRRRQFLPELRNVFKASLIYSDAQAKGWVPWGALAPFLCLAFVIAGGLIGLYPMDRLGLADADGNPVGSTGLIGFLLLQFGLTGALVLAWVRWVERRRLASIGLVRDGILGKFLRGYAVGLASMLGLVMTIWLAGGYQAAGYGAAFSSPGALLTILLLLLGFVLQASVEEVVFRGWLLSVLARKFNVPLAVLLSSVLFCFLHFDRDQHALVPLNVFLFALFTACWALSSRHVWSVMGWHSAWNWLLATGFAVPVTGLDAGVPAWLVTLNPVAVEWLTGGAQGPEGSILCTLYFVGSIAWLTRAWRKRRGPAPAAS